MTILSKNSPKNNDDGSVKLSLVVRKVKFYIFYFYLAPRLTNICQREHGLDIPGGQLDKRKKKVCPIVT